MVLESILNPLKAEKKPLEMFVLGLVYSSIAIFLSLWIFGDQASLIAVFLTVMACIPIVYNTMKLEEGKDLEILREGSLLKEHNKALIFLMLLFIGITVSSVFWYVVLPANTTSILFERQSQTIANINNNISGNMVQQFGIFSKILFNNVRVLAFAVLFAFVYGAGAIFILTWNATVIGTAMGNFISTNISKYAGAAGLGKVGAYFQVVSLSVLRYSIHGIREILAYFYGGLAGGIISVAIIKHHYESEKFSHIMHDASDLLLIAIGFLVIAALLEVFVTPILF